MAEPLPPAPAPLPPHDLPEARVVSRRGRAFPWFWIIPLLAVMIGLGVMIKSILDQGPTIHITWKNAEGIEVGKTHIKYKNVDIGVVNDVRIADNGKGVVVDADINHDAAKLLVTDTHFWVVRPRIAGGQISGLATLISGSYIGMNPALSSSCMATRLARSMSAHHCSIGGCRSVRSPRLTSTAMAKA
jgi:paraquat-inducible protein B